MEVIHSEDTIIKMGEQNKGKHRSIKTETKKGIFGNKTIGWKGGLTSLQTLIRTSNKYSEWRLMIFGRDNFTCQECGKRGSWLEAHHKKTFAKIVKDNNIKTLEESFLCDKLWNIENGITLCKECHKKTFGESWQV